MQRATGSSSSSSSRSRWRAQQQQQRPCNQPAMWGLLPPTMLQHSMYRPV
jgi:hypothetical protein